MLGYHHFILYENKETHLVDSYAAISNSSSTGAILKTIASTLSANAALFFDIFPIIEIHLQCLKSPLTASFQTKESQNAAVGTLNAKMLLMLICNSK